MTGARLLGLLLPLGLVAFSCLQSSAWAEVALRTSLSSETIEVGQKVQLRVEAESSDESVEKPRLTIPRGFEASGPQVGTQQKITIVNGRMERSVGTTATWVLIPTRVGTFRIGPASFDASGRVVRGETVTLKVVAEGTLSDTRRRRGRSPFPFDDDPFQGMRGGSLFDELFGNSRPRRRAAAPPEYQTHRALDSVAFLRATVTPARAVVGQQVTLRVYAYGARGLFTEGSSKEPRHPDFFAYPILGNSAKQQHYSVDIQGRDYAALKVREVALFPLKPGDLVVGAMQMNFYGRSYASRTNPEGLERSSIPLTVHVQEPPTQTRPAGYQLGDVGDFRLAATVEPRQVEAGGAVSVVATLEGTGRLPQNLIVPEQKGVKWLEPAITDREQVDANKKLSGTRTFTYLVRLEQRGKVDLGELSLPYYSPRLGRYQVARAKLGEVTVTGSEAQPVASSESALSEQFNVRTTYEPLRTKPFYLADQPWFFPTLAAAPLLVFVGRGAYGFLLAASRRRERVKASPSEQAKQALRHARKALGSGDHGDAIAAAERAVFLGIEGALALKARALLLSELEPRLVRAGLREELAARIAKLLSQFEQARFGGAEAEVDELVRAVKPVVQALDQHARRRKVS